MLTRRFLLIVVIVMSLLAPAGAVPAGSRAGDSATGFKGTVKRLPTSSMARGALTVLAINPNRATIVRARHLDAKSGYKMTVPPGLYMVGAEGLESDVAFTHALRLREGQMRTVDLPPKKGPGSSEPRRSPTSLNRSAAAASQVVTVGPITVHGIPELGEGTDLWHAFDIELEKGSRPRCKVDYTSDRIRELVQQELDFQQSHYVDPSTRIKPNLVTPTSRVSGTITQSDGVVTMSLTETDLETGDVNQTESVSGPVDSFDSFIALIESIGTKVGRNLCPPNLVTGTITYSETSSYTSGAECCADDESLTATIDVSMKAYKGNVGYGDDGSSYSIQYSRTSSGRQSGCDYEGTWSGSGSGPVGVDAGKLVEPGDTSPTTGQPAETHELLVGVERELEYTHSGSETYSGCENPSNDSTIPYPEAVVYLEDVYGACAGTSGYLEFKSADESSTTLELTCSRTDEGGTSYTLNSTLTLSG